MEPMYIGGTCAACDCLLLHGLGGEEIVQFPCGHEVHEACLYDHGESEDEDEGEDEEMCCPACDTPLSPDPSSDDDSGSDLSEDESGSTETMMAELTSEDAVIAVLGPIGAGKSFFIRAATEDESIKVGKMTEPVNKFSAHRTEIDGQSVVFIDTVGFDDTHQSHTDVLRTLAIWLAEMDIKNIHLAGVIYMHDVESSQSMSASERNLRVLRKLAGESTPKKTLFVTNDWEESSFSVGEGTTVALTEDFDMRDHFIRKGIEFERFAGTKDDARRILRSIIEDVYGARSVTQRDWRDDSFDPFEQVSSFGARDEHEIFQLRNEFEDMLKSIRFEIFEREVQYPSWLEEQLDEQDYELSDIDLQYDTREELQLVHTESLRRTEHLIEHRIEDLSTASLSSIEDEISNAGMSQTEYEREELGPAFNRQDSIWTLLIRLWEILQRAPSAPAGEDEEEDWDSGHYLYMPCSFDGPPLDDRTFSDDLYVLTSPYQETTWSTQLPWRLRPGLARLASEGDLYLKQHTDWFLSAALIFCFLFVNSLVIGMMYFWKRKSEDTREIDIRAW